VYGLILTLNCHCLQQIQHPTASLIARASTAQDDMTGDGTTSTVLVIGEMLKQADVFISEGLHPRIIAEGFDQGRKKALEVLDKIKIAANVDKESLTGVARTALRTKLHANLADQLSDVIFTYIRLYFTHL
jgi:T-complex protein 1 subunit zeta